MVKTEECKWKRDQRVYYGQGAGIACSFMSLILGFVCVIYTGAMTPNAPPLPPTGCLWPFLCGPQRRAGALPPRFRSVRRIIRLEPFCGWKWAERVLFLAGKGKYILPGRFGWETTNSKQPGQSLGSGGRWWRRTGGFHLQWRGRLRAPGGGKGGAAGCLGRRLAKSQGAVTNWFVALATRNAIKGVAGGVRRFDGHRVTRPRC